jgi:arylsulfatase A-like enzyme
MKLAVVLVRNLSAGWLGAYGNEWVATPNLDRLAAEGIVFERHIADRVDAQPDSYAGDVKRFDDLVPPWDVPIDVFETYAEEFDGLPPVNEPGPIPPDDLTAWEALRCSYAAVLTRLDAKLGRLFEELRGHRIVVTADRGFPLGEHGVVGHDGARAHQEMVHLPLIVWEPGGSRAGTRVDGFTQPRAIQAVLARLGVNSDKDGNNLPDQSEWRAIIESIVRSVAITRRDTGAVAAIRTADWTCLLPGSFDANDDDKSVSARLYQFPDDGHEQNDLADRHAEAVAELTTLAGRDDDYSNDDERGFSKDFH